jgi:hypothetical protein
MFEWEIGVSRQNSEGSKCLKGASALFCVLEFIFGNEVMILKRNYSDPPNTEPRSVFGFDLMPVPGIWIPNRSKTGHLCPVASLDWFITKRVIKKIFMPKRSWLAVKNVRSSFQNRKPDKKSGIQMFLTKWPPNLAFYHSKTGHKKRPKNDHLNTGWSGIRWVTNSKLIKKIVGRESPSSFGKGFNAMKI